MNPRRLWIMLKGSVYKFPVFQARNRCRLTETFDFSEVDKKYLTQNSPSTWGWMKSWNRYMEKYIPFLTRKWIFWLEIFIFWKAWIHTDTHYTHIFDTHLADQVWQIGKKEMANVKHTWLLQIFYTHNTDTKSKYRSVQSPSTE